MQRADFYGRRERAGAIAGRLVGRSLDATDEAAVALLEPVVGDGRAAGEEVEREALGGASRRKRKRSHQTRLGAAAVWIRSTSGLRAPS